MDSRNKTDAEDMLATVGNYINSIYRENQTNLRIISALNEKLIEKDNRIHELEKELEEWKKNFQ
jgi:predicted RNase H-like nuclease (RuvC/YqgF family)